MNKRSGIHSREKIIAAAMDIFVKSGYRDANIRDIAKKAEISVGGIYIYFKNKEELYKSLVADMRREMAAVTETAVHLAQSASQALSDFLKLHFDYALRHREFILLHIREHGFTFGIDERKQFFRNQRRLIEEILNRGIRDGEFRKCNAPETAKIIMGSLRGIMLSMALDKEALIAPETLSDFFFRSLVSTGKEDRPI